MPAAWCDGYQRVACVGGGEPVPGEIVRQGLIGANPVLFAEGVPNSAAAHLSLMLGLKGGCQTIIGSRTSGLDALHLAALRIRAGDEPLPGGYPTPVTHASGEDPVFVGRIRNKATGGLRWLEVAGRMDNHTGRRAKVVGIVADVTSRYAS